MRYCAIILLLLFCGRQEAFAQSKEILQQVDSLKEISESDVHDTIRVRALMEWDNLIFYFEPETDLILNEQVIQICENHLQHSQLNIDEYKYYANAVTSASNNLGLGLTDFGDFGGAVKAYYKSLKYANALADSASISKAYNNMGLAYQRQKLLDKAIENFEIALENCSDCIEVQRSYYNNMGVVYSDTGNYKLAAHYYKEGLKLVDSTVQEASEANIYANMGTLYMDQYIFDSAYYFFDKALKMYQNMSDVEGVTYILTNQARTYLLDNQPGRALELIRESVPIAEKSGGKIYIGDAYAVAADVFEKIGQKDSAIFYLKKKYDIDVQMFSTESYESAANFEHRVKYERQHLQDSLTHSNELKVQAVEHDADLRDEKNKLYLVYGGAGLMLLLLFVTFRSYRRKKQDNELISRQKKEVESHRGQLEEKNKEITDSISYAKRIQDAILPSDNKFQRTLGDNSFLIYLPKDIVAGDFYWIEETEQHLFYAVADCTGHGVPGAMVSVICHNSLNRCVREFKLSSPAEILTKCRELVISHFSESDRQVKDGMDIALIVKERSSGKLIYAGAHNNLYQASNGKMKEYDADKQPIGFFEMATDFKETEVSYQSGDRIFLSTDGYPDQFGGPKGKKFKYKAYKELLLKSSTKAVKDQKDEIIKTFNEWKGSYEQLDDVCIIGIQL